MRLYYLCFLLKCLLIFFNVLTWLLSVSFAIEILLLICGSPGTGYTKEHTVRDL